MQAAYETDHPIFPTRRVAAGYYYDANKGHRIRYTSVHNRSRPTKILDAESPDGASLPDWDEETLVSYIQQAERWSECMGRPAMSKAPKLQPPQANLVLEQTRWRRFYGLETDGVLLAR